MLFGCALSAAWRRGPSRASAELAPLQVGEDGAVTVLDLGDMSASWLVADAAIGAAYLMSSRRGSLQRLSKLAGTEFSAQLR